MSHPLSPWKMWGQSKVFVFTAGTFNPSEQISRVQYGRPESWRFLLAAQIIDGPVRPEAVQVQVDFDIAVGIGLTNFQTVPNQGLAYQSANNFLRLNFVIPAGAVPGQQPSKWTNQVPTPAFDDTAPAQRGLLDLLVGEDIQVSASVNTSSETGEYRVRVFSLWSPNVHVRPDWFKDKFLGELGGH